jgi:predicted GNAT family N-acyltransferase
LTPDAGDTTFTFGKAETEEDLEAVYRFRYDVYVDEMGRYRDVADHERRRFVEPEDEHSWIFFAREDDEVVATARMTWGGDRFSERQIHHYHLERYVQELPPEMMIVGERLMVAPRLRGSGLVEQLVGRSHQLNPGHDIRINFGACEPHLLSLYLGWGERTYAPKNINSAEAGYLIPIVGFPKGVDALVGLGRGPDDDATSLPRCIRDIVEGGSGTVSSGVLSESEAYRTQVDEALQQYAHDHLSAFDGFTPEEEERCLARSNIIECAAGDHVVKKGGSAHNVFVVLHGHLEARDGDRVLAVLSPGDVFGEMAFLLERPRAMDIYAATDGARVLSLSEHTLRTMIAEDSEVAAKLLMNISKMLCLRLVKTA